MDLARIEISSVQAKTDIQKATSNEYSATEC
jgi:hypothetical protein